MANSMWQFKNKTIIHMKKNLILFTIVLLFAAVSCAPVQKESQQQPNPQQMNQMQISRLKQDASALNSTGTTATTAPVQNAAPAQGNTAVRLNPPHGQPGHICEIPVGSPLPEAPAKTNAIVNSTPVATPANRPTAPTAASNVRLNPPHGQPGHICEIPVGSPLPSE
jgi:hypothetical protein